MAGTGKIADLIQRLDALASPQWRESLSRQLAEQALQLIDDGFKRRQDPYGEKWAPTKQPNPILERTGIMRGTWGKKTVSPSGFVVSTVDYAIFAQAGTEHAARSSAKTKKESPARKTPPRRMVPVNNVMPMKWQQAFDRVIVRAVKETMGA
jgi:hypothetical protein